MQLNRREFLQTATAAAMAAPFTASAEETPAYNVVVLMSDEHNPKFTSVQGHPFLQTPNLERLAARGTLFENGYCPSPLCHPSRSAFLTGRRTHEIQVYNNCNVVSYDYPGYGAVLAGQGVHTVHLGKSDFYRPVAEAGFSECIEAHDRPRPGDLNVSRNPLAIRVGDGQQRAHAWGVREHAWAGDTAVVDAALEWLRTRPQTLGKPFTLVANVNAPHFPHYNTQAIWERYPQGADLPAHGFEAASAKHPYAQDLQNHFETHTFNEEQIRGLRRGYLGCVTYIDHAVGRFLDTLDQAGLSENTVFIYCSDHGEMLGKFGMWWKCSLYEDSVRVPIYACGPGFQAGKRVAAPAGLLDVQATLFAATGKSRPAGWSGQPLQEVAKLPADRPIFSEYHGHGTRGSSFMVREGDWKLLWHHGAASQLFNLAEDPEELNNCSGKGAKVEQDLQTLLRSFVDPEAEHARAEAFIEEQEKMLAALQGT
ncbi:MAG: sulfatase-like hydrolase/transferase [Candidatus Hydrogenedentes bacterium]|nr:sulfatase-like hydrolase/transferase [Candidatus Hydrogenedentota bacterium]